VQERRLDNLRQQIHLPGLQQAEPRILDESSMIALENTSTLEHFGIAGALFIPGLLFMNWYLYRDNTRLERILRVRENHIAQLNKWCDQHHKEIR
jgi:hypothetical protein